MGRKLNTTPGQGSLTTLNISDEELTGFASPSGPTSWESLLNWSPNFNAFVGVFKDIAELPDIDSDVRPNPLGDREEDNISEAGKVTQISEEMFRKSLKKCY